MKEPYRTTNDNVVVCKFEWTAMPKAVPRDNLGYAAYLKVVENCLTNKL